MAKQKRKPYVTVRPDREPKADYIPCMGQVHIGDIVTRCPITITDKLDAYRGVARCKGKVIWIHPKGRFHVVEFGEGACTARESFIGVSKEELSKEQMRQLHI